MENKSNYEIMKDYARSIGIPEEEVEGYLKAMMFVYAMA